MKGYSRMVVVVIFILSKIENANSQIVADTATILNTDSILQTDPTVQFFQKGEKIKELGRVSLQMINKKIFKLGTFLKSTDMNSAEHVLADLDLDGSKELLISNFTGGAHCCDEIYIFKKITASKYLQVAKLYAGQVLITRGNEFVYSFGEHFGYFFTCFACAYTDTSDAAPIEIRSIALHYSKGKMVIIPGNQELRSIILDNLGKLGELPYEAIDDEIAQDNGQRKEFAINLAVFYYSFGKNLATTKSLFNKYYQYPDAKKVWSEFVRQINYISRSNFF